MLKRLFQYCSCQDLQLFQLVLLLRVRQTQWAFTHSLSLSLFWPNLHKTICRHSLVMISVMREMMKTWGIGKTTNFTMVSVCCCYCVWVWTNALWCYVVGWWLFLGSHLYLTRWGVYCGSGWSTGPGSRPPVRMDWQMGIPWTTVKSMRQSSRK